MSWFSFALLLIQVADKIFGWLRDKQQLDAGRDAEVAKATAAILVKTQTAKDVMVQVTGMTDEQVDKALKELEP